MFFLSRYQGRFPKSDEEARELPEITSFAHWSWHDNVRCVEVEAPVETIDPSNGIRTVSDKGKPSRSRFQLLAYDSASDSSLISCAPLSGRGHQLRVHLQWLGFPIEGDLAYGGRPLDTGSMDIAVQRMTEVIGKDELSALALDSISSEDVASARSACQCCQNGVAGIVSSFTPAQLLVGSAIHLHALRYEIPIPPRKRKTIDGNGRPLAVLSMEVGLPKWALEYGDVELDWLQE